MAEENETEIICPLCMYGYILPDSPLVSTFLQKPCFSELGLVWGLPGLPRFRAVGIMYTLATCT